MANDLKMRLNCIRVAFFAALAVAVLSGSRVGHASCGDYVYSRFHTPAHQGRTLNQHSDADYLDLTSSDSEISQTYQGESDASHSTPAQPAPCHGPNCSQNPAPLVPFAPPTSAGGSNQDRLMIGQLSFELPSNVSSLEDVQSHARKRRGFPLLIEMPPEFAG